MQVLTVDVGTGTQDIFLYDSLKSLENGYQLVMPSPTVRLANRVKEATRQKRSLLLEGVLMGGGPVGWAVRDHALAGNEVYCLADAARTFDDDPARVAQMGIRVIAEEEVRSLVGRHPDLERLKLGDFDFGPVAAAFAAFGFELKPDALAIAVFDHGAAPPDISDRTFRFEFIAESLGQTNDLSVFAYPADRIPPRLTRFEAVARTAQAQLPGLPVLLMDTGPAAALGALDDPMVAQAVADCAIVANLGNFHTLAFLFEQGQIRGTFEHHTGEVRPEQLTGFLEKLAGGSLSNREIFDSQGHGAVYLSPPDRPPGLLAVTGPRRAMLRDQFVQLEFTSLAPYFAVPNGDMMLAGNYGLLKALAWHFPNLPLNLDQSRRGLALDW